MEGHRREDEGSAPIVRGIPMPWLIGAIATIAFTSGGLMLQMSKMSTDIEKLDVKLDQRLNQMEENQRRANVEMQTQKVEFAEFKGEVRAFITRREPPRQQ